MAILIQIKLQKQIPDGHLIDPYIIRRLRILVQIAPNPIIGLVKKQAREALVELMIGQLLIKIQVETAKELGNLNLNGCVIARVNARQLWLQMTRGALRLAPENLAATRALITVGFVSLTRLTVLTVDLLRKIVDQDLERVCFICDKYLIAVDQLIDRVRVTR